jgi:protein involved in polysaccharide export with SLBB domain
MLLSVEKVQSEAGATEVIQVGQQIVREVKATEALGRLVVDLDEVRRGGVEIVAKDGDVLIIPRQTQEVTVIGEVQYPTSHVFVAKRERGDYIERNGGPTSKADGDRIFLVRANARVAVGASMEIHPGDTIVVPFDTRRMRPLAFWSVVAQICCQFTLTAAAAQAVGVL